MRLHLKNIGVTAGQNMKVCLTSLDRVLDVT